MVTDQFAFLCKRVADGALLGHLHTQTDKVGGEVDTFNLVELSRQFKTGATTGAAEVQRFTGRLAPHGFQSNVRHGSREILDTKPGVAVMEFRVLSQQPVAFVVGVGLHRLAFRGDVAEPRVLEEVSAEGVAGR